MATNNSEIRKIQKSFLKALVDNGGQWKWTLDGLERQLGYERKAIIHAAHLMEDEGRVTVRGKEHPTLMIYEITPLGRQQFDPWYMKGWRFFTNDFAKILSVISLALSIAATLLVWLK